MHTQYNDIFPKLVIVHFDFWFWQSALIGRPYTYSLITYQHQLSTISTRQGWSWCLRHSLKLYQPNLGELILINRTYLPGIIPVLLKSIRQRELHDYTSQAHKLGLEFLGRSPGQFVSHADRKETEKQHEVKSARCRTETDHCRPRRRERVRPARETTLAEDDAAS